MRLIPIPEDKYGAAKKPSEEEPLIEPEETIIEMEPARSIFLKLIFTFSDFQELPGKIGQ